MNCSFRTETVKSVFKLVAKSARLFTLLHITLITVSPAIFAQGLQIKKEVAFGTTNFDFGNHRVIVNSTGDIVTISKHQFDSSANKQWLVSRFNKQLSPLGSTVTTLNANNLDVNAVIEAADKGYVIVGSGEIRKTPNGPIQYDVRVDKMTATGSFRFDKSFGGNGSDKGVGIQQTPDGGYLVIVNSFSTDQDIQNTTGKSQIWLAKIDANGDKIWGKLLTNTHAHEATDFIKTPDGNFALCGNVRSDVPLGPGAGTGEGLIMKFREDGTLIWQNYIGGSSEEDNLARVIMDPAGNFIAAGSTKSNIGSENNRGGTDGWITKINPQGGVIFNKLVGGSGEDKLQSVTLSATGIITAGGSTTSKDGDLTDNVYGHTLWITRLTTDNSSTSHGFPGHPLNNPSSIEDITTAPDGNIYCVANTNEANVFLKNPIGGNDGWLFSLGEKNIFTGSVYIDQNKNGKKDIDERFFTGGKFEISQPSNPVPIEFVVSNNGKFETWLDTGSYNVRFIADQPYYNISPGNKTFTFPAFNLSDSMLVSLVPGVIKNDLVIDIIPSQIPRPGFNVSYTIQYKNIGTTIMNDITVKFIKDSLLDITGIIPSNVVTNGDTISWSVRTLNPLDSGKVIINGKLKAPPATANGDTLITKAIVLPELNDANIDDNTKILTEIVRGSYDPNDKTEFHGGLLPAVSVGSEKLAYLIRFQNTGTDTAFNIYVRDTLNANVDPSTLQMISSSHGFTLSRKNGNQLEWKFENIMLPDSNMNEKASHGYILYSVKARPTLVAGDLITNRASIYFDFNLPVVTNTTITKIVDLVLPKPILSGLQSSYCRSLGSQTLQITNVALAGQATITVKLNNNPVTVDQSGRFTIQPSLLQSGIQTITISFTSNTATASLSTQFSITAAAKPEVKLASNFNSVNNGSTTIILAATQMGGGGATPLYTFATNRNFTNLIQGESLINTIAFNSQILNNGDNWLYVRMKTSESCYTSLSTVDSIKIIRLSVTSIVDINFPATTIFAYPNPFKSEITVKGLQPTASYTIQLIDATGRIIVVKEVENKSSITFASFSLKNGQYFIRLYDKKTYRLIGFISVLRI